MKNGFWHGIYLEKLGDGNKSPILTMFWMEWRWRESNPRPKL